MATGEPLLYSVAMNKPLAWLVALSLPWAPLLRADTNEVAPTPERGLVYVIPVHGMIEPALLYVIRRGVAEADRQQAAALVLSMDTLGGRLDAATEIVRLMQSVKVPTYTFVEKNAISAGAIIALSTDRIFMAPGSVIGDAMPIMMSPTGGAQEMPEAIEEKTVSAVSALIRAAAQESGHDPQLAEAMVRREIEYKIGDEIISPAGQLLTLTNVEAEREVGPEGDRRKLLSSGTQATLNAMLEAEGLAQKAGMEELVIFVIGIGLIALEIFVLPGFGIPGILGITLVLWSLLSAMMHRLPGGSWLPSPPELQQPVLKLSLAIVLTAVLASLLSKLLPKTPLYGHLVLQQATSSRQGYAAGPTGDGGLLGALGIALTALRPGGSIQLGERRMDVVSRGEFIEPQSRVRVVEVHGNRVVVEQAEPEGRA